MKIKLLGELDDNLTGSMTLLELDNGVNIIIDFGLTQFNDGKIASSMIYNGREFEFDVRDIDYVVITHAHADHLNLLPLLVKRGYDGKIITTAPTAEFANISLRDTVKIFESDCKWYNNNNVDSIEPIYNEADVNKTVSMMQCYDFNDIIKVSSDTTIQLVSSGHMLGACMVVVNYNGEKIVFTGDTSGLTSRKPFLPPADSLGEVDYVVIESTYGDRVHQKVDVRNVLRESIKNTCIKNNGTLLIPVFSIQRSSELIWLLRDVYLSNTNYNKIPIYLDSPLAIKSQEVLQNNKEYWGERWVKDDFLKGGIYDWDVVQYVNDYRESELLNDGHPKILLSSSGMCNGGRIVNHLKDLLPHKDNMVLFTGYQVQGTIGHAILSGKNTISVSGNRVDVRANVGSIPFSSHADKNQLISLLQTTKKGVLKNVFVTHGSVESKEYFKKYITHHLRGVKAEVLRRGIKYNVRRGSECSG